MKTIYPSDWKTVQTRAGVAVIIRSTDGSICLEQRQDCGLWGPVGGRVEAGESVSAAAIREAREETGLEIEIEYLQGIYSDPAQRTVQYSDIDSIQLIDTVFVARILAGQLRCSEESLSVAFFTLDKLPDALVAPAHAILEDYRRGLRGIAR